MSADVRRIESLIASADSGLRSVGVLWATGGLKIETAQAVKIALTKRRAELVKELHAARSTR